MKSADGRHSLKLGGYLQADGRFLMYDVKDVAPHDFSVRRVRPTLEATLYERFELRFMPDFGAGKVLIQDAYADAKVAPWLRFRVGKMKAPFGIERLVSATSLVLIERGLPTSLVPNRDVGAMVHGEIGDGVVSYGVGIFDGTADGSSVDGDTDDDKDIVGRVFVKPFAATSLDALRGLGLGFAMSVGQAHGEVGATGLPSIKTSAQQTMVSFVNATAPEETALAWGTRTRFSPQGSYYFGPLGLYGEYVQTTTDVKLGAVEDELKLSSYQIAGHFVVTGEAASDKGVTPDKGVTEGGFGAIELGLRFHALKLDGPAFDDGFAKPEKTVKNAKGVTAGVTYHLEKGIKVQVNYDRTTFSGGDKDGGNRANESALLTRFQVAF